MDTIQCGNYECKHGCGCNYSADAKPPRIRFAAYDHEDQIITLKADRVNIKFYMNDDYMVVEDHYEYNVIDDITYAIFFLVSGHHYTLAYLFQEAEAQRPSLEAEHMQEHADEQNMARELSSVEKTGRI